MSFKEPLFKSIIEIVVWADEPVPGDQDNVLDFAQDLITFVNSKNWGADYQVIKQVELKPTDEMPEGVRLLFGVEKNEDEEED